VREASDLGGYNRQLLPGGVVVVVVDVDDAVSERLVPVHLVFRVLALMLVDPHRQLDPPVRSRFQIHRIDSPITETLYEHLVVAHNIDNNSNTAAAAPPGIPVAAA
jgi:hypothetical protein